MAKRKLIFLLGKCLQLWQYPFSLASLFFIFYGDGEKLKERLFLPNFDISGLFVIVHWLPTLFPFSHWSRVHCIPQFSSKITLFYL